MNSGKPHRLMNRHTGLSLPNRVWLRVRPVVVVDPLFTGSIGRGTPPDGSPGGSPGGSGDIAAGIPESGAALVATPHAGEPAPDPAEQRPTDAGLRELVVGHPGIERRGGQ